MKQPKMTNLRVDAAGTKKVRTAMQRSRCGKITINTDADSLSALRDTACLSACSTGYWKKDWPIGI